MALRIAALQRINGPACSHLRLTIEESDNDLLPVADRSAILEIPQSMIEAEDRPDWAALAESLSSFPGRAAIKAVYLLSWAIYQRRVNGLTVAQIVGVWVD